MQFCYSCSDIDPLLNQWSKNISAPSGTYFIRQNRMVTKEDIKTLELKKMPGFRFTWQFYYNDKPMDPEDAYSPYDLNSEYARLVKNYLIKFDLIIQTCKHVGRDRN